jgi:hypothetical protein
MHPAAKRCFMHKISKQCASRTSRRKHKKLGKFIKQKVIFTSFSLQYLTPEAMALSPLINANYKSIQIHGETASQAKVAQ